MPRDSVTRGLRDEADVGPDPRAPRELRRLSELRYKVADGEPDIRGWKAYASTGRELGTVSDLLVDVDAGEVVMLDVDLRRNDRHTLAPVRAAWIDHAAQRVVLDAREAERAMAGGTSAAPVSAPPPAADDDVAGVPALPRAGTLSDDDVRRFNDDYARAYGERGVEADHSYRLRRGDEELRFGSGPRRLLDPASVPTAPTASVPATLAPARRATETDPAEGMHFDESARINAELSAPSVAAARRDAGRGEDLAAADARFAVPAERRVDRVDSADDALAMDDARGIDPRELDGRVRIDEGATVDDRTPVAGVRYEGDDPAPHHYGQPADAYGPEYGSGRIGFDKVVSRGPYAADADAPLPEARLPEAPAPDAAPNADEPRSLRYRQYGDRYAGPDDAR